MYFLGLGTFICLVYFSPQNRTVGNILSLFSFYKKKVWISKKCGGLPKDTKPVSGTAKILTEAIFPSLSVVE